MVQACQTLVGAGRLVKLPLWWGEKGRTDHSAGAEDPTQFRVSGGAMCPAEPESGERAKGSV